MPRALSAGLGEANANLLWTRDARPQPAAGFGPWRDRVEALRPALYRLVVDWAKVQPDAGRAPDWGIPDGGCMRGLPPCGEFKGTREILEAVRSQQRAHGGWAVSVVIYGTPTWAAHQAQGCERSTATAFARPLTDLGLDGYRRLIRSLLALGREVGVQLRYWSPWNEPNHPAFISPQRSRCDVHAPALAPAVYARLARALLDELRAAPGAQELVLGDFAGFSTSSPKRTSIAEFVGALPDDVACAGRVWGQHAYVDPTRPGGVPRDDPIGALKRVLDRRACTRAATIHITETGAGAPHAGDDRPADPAAESRTCAALAQLLAGWARDPRVSAAFQYTFREDPAFPVGLADARLQRLYPEYGVWRALGTERAGPTPARCRASATAAGTRSTGTGASAPPSR